VFDQVAAEADLTLVIAPELDGALIDRCRRVEQCGGRLLGPGVNLIELCSDKQHTADHLAAAGVPTPQGMPIGQGETLPADFPYPAVLKPRDGCGSHGVQLFPTWSEAARFGTAPWSARLERFCPGIPASVALLCGSNVVRVLPPCRQRLSGDSRFAYHGGELPLPPDLARRAAALALRTVRTLPEPRGYVGVDLVLGHSSRHVPRAVAESEKSLADGPSRHTECAYYDADYVIEINPRLTTSYVGLRAACRGNLAEALLKIAQGEPAELSFRDDPLQFDADGTVRFLQGKQ
jgi:predicted ATP-grasp superfamily ATP-dependent carboligase